ncbi:hypothetical protein, partial [Neisseria gonorrhoeae]|uniref:hypothetical protein n=1 Tax=Neisseria gonorrhoeae TaxID=485 RepID=UPI001C59B7A2
CACIGRHTASMDRIRDILREMPNLMFLKIYSGLTKTGTALPRLAVLSVLSAASSPCPDFC